MSTMFEHMESAFLKRQAEFDASGITTSPEERQKQRLQKELLDLLKEKIPTTDEYKAMLQAAKENWK